MSGFSPVFDSLSKITGIAKGLLDTHIQVQINNVAIELQGAILDLQSKVSAVQSEYQEALRAKEDAEKKLVACEKWERDSARYLLQPIVPGIFAYRLKPGDYSGEPVHWLCPTCYQDKKKSILHPDSSGSDVLVCPRDQQHILITGDRSAMGASHTATQ